VSGGEVKRLKSFPIKMSLYNPILNSPDTPREGSCWKFDSKCSVMASRMGRGGGLALKCAHTQCVKSYYDGS
jgi:hypothetical protein